MSAAVPAQLLHEFPFPWGWAAELCWSWTPRWTQVSSCPPYVTSPSPPAADPVCAHHMLRAISPAGREHKGLFLGSAGYCKTGNVLFFTRRCFAAQPGWASPSPVPRQDFGSVWGREGANPEGTAGTSRNSVEMAGVGLSQLLQTAQSSPCKQQVLSWLGFLKVPRFGALA